MLRWIIFLLSLCITSMASAHGTGRICSNPYCSMCMYLHLQAGHGVSNPGSDIFGLHQQLHNSSSSAYQTRTTQSYQTPRTYQPGTVRAQVTEERYAAQELPQGTPNIVVTGMLILVKPKPTEVLYDLGCGDGRVVIAAAKKYGCRAVGVEIDPKIADIARQNVLRAGLQNLVTIVTADARSISLDNADIIVMYLFPDLISELQPEIFKAKRIVSYSHKIPNVTNKGWSVSWHGVKYPVYIWERPRSPWSMMPPSR